MARVPIAFIQNPTEEDIKELSDAIGRALENDKEEDDDGESED